jgi:hypothetical protein
MMSFIFQNVFILFCNYLFYFSYIVFSGEGSGGAAGARAPPTAATTMEPP